MTKYSLIAVVVGVLVIGGVTVGCVLVTEVGLAGVFVKEVAGDEEVVVLADVVVGIGEVKPVVVVV